MGKRPGIMVYFEILDALEDYNTEEIGQLFLAMLRYGDTGVLPEFTDRGMRTLWLSTKQKLDLDNLRYEQTCSNRRYSTYVREAKKRGEVFLDREEWAMSLEEERSNDINSIQLQQQPELQPEQQLQHQKEYINISHQPSAVNWQPSAVNRQQRTAGCRGLSVTAADFEQRRTEAMEKLVQHRTGTP